MKLCYQVNTEQEPSDLSSPKLPYIHAPADFSTNGLPYGAWCKCFDCGDIGQSTATFDFYKVKETNLLQCELCMMKSHE